MSGTDAWKYGVDYRRELNNEEARRAVLADKKVIAVGTIDELIALDHPWIEEYFKGPRGRAAIAAKDEVADIRPRSADTDAARHPTEVDADATGHHSQGSAADAHARGEAGTR